MKKKNKNENVNMNPLENAESFAIDFVALNISIILFDDNGDILGKTSTEKPVIINSYEFTEDEKKVFSEISKKLIGENDIEHTEITCRSSKSKKKNKE